MEFFQVKIGQYCDDQKQAEKQEGIRDAASNYFPISYSSSSHGSASYSNHQRLCVGPTFDVDHVAEEDAPGTRRSYHGGAAAGSGTGTKIQDLARTGTTTTLDVVDHHESYKVHGGGGGSRGGKSWSTMEEREHMFDKVVTPSDVGKLNRLVIPKQHAERYFPLIIANEKGLLLNFEDRNGKPWRFRYSYWSSSQSYVITKGWSRFVKEKQLDAGDVVSFQRGAGESGKGRLYIDWRRSRLHPPPPDHHHHHHHHHVLHVHHPTASSPALSSIPSSARLYQPVPDYNSMYMPIIGPYNNNYNNKMKQKESCSSGGGGIDQLGQPLQYYCHLNFRPLAPPRHQIGDLQSQPPMIMNSSVPLVHDDAAAAAPKRLRLFGVNMDCSSISIPQESKGQLVLPSVPYANSSPPSGLFSLRR